MIEPNNDRSNSLGSGVDIDALNSLATVYLKRAEALRNASRWKILSILVTIALMSVLVVVLPPLASISEDFVLGAFGHQTSHYDLQAETANQAASVRNKSSQLLDFLEDKDEIVENIEGLQKRVKHIYSAREIDVPSGASNLTVSGIEVLDGKATIHGSFVFNGARHVLIAQYRDENWVVDKSWSMQEGHVKAFVSTEKGLLVFKTFDGGSELFLQTGGEWKVIPFDITDLSDIVVTKDNKYIFVAGRLDGEVAIIVLDNDLKEVARKSIVGSKIVKLEWAQYAHYLKVVIDTDDGTEAKYYDFSDLELDRLDGFPQIDFWALPTKIKFQLKYEKDPLRKLNLRQELNTLQQRMYRQPQLHRNPKLQLYPKSQLPRNQSLLAEPQPQEFYFSDYGKLLEFSIFETTGNLSVITTDSGVLFDIDGNALVYTENADFPKVWRISPSIEQKIRKFLLGSDSTENTTNSLEDQPALTQGLQSAKLHIREALSTLNKHYGENKLLSKDALNLFNELEDLAQSWETTWVDREKNAMILEHLRKADIASDSWRNISSIATRLAVIALLVYLVNILVNLYRYQLRLSAFHQARHDTLKTMIAIGGDFSRTKELSLSQLADTYTPEPVTFGARPVPPTEVISQLLKDTIK